MIIETDEDDINMRREAQTAPTWWLDDLAPFKTDAGDDFWPVNAGEFDSAAERRIADAYSEEAARLIVVAPKMLAALRRAQVLLMLDLSEFTEADLANAGQVVAEAIAAAEGR